MIEGTGETFWIALQLRPKIGVYTIHRGGWILNLSTTLGLT